MKFTHFPPDFIVCTNLSSSNNHSHQRYSLKTPGTNTGIVPTASILWLPAPGGCSQPCRSHIPANSRCGPGFQQLPLRALSQSCHPLPASPFALCSQFRRLPISRRIPAAHRPLQPFPSSFLPSLESRRERRSGFCIFST